VKNKLTLQGALALTILMIGLIGLGLVFTTEYTYRKLAHEYQQDALEALLSAKSRDLINELIKYQKQLGFSLQSETTFRQALKDGDNKKLMFWLDEEFNRYFVTIGLMKLEKLVVFDTDLNPIAISSRGIRADKLDDQPCRTLVQVVHNLPVVQRLKPHSELCYYNDRPLLSTLIAIGSLETKGYIQVISDPAHILANIERELGAKVQIRSANGDILHQSDDWPEPADAAADFLYSKHEISASSGETAIVVTAATNIHAFNERLQQTSTRLTVLAGLLILLAVLIAYSIIKFGLKPLKSLQAAATSIGQGEFVSVNERGFPEVSTPIKSFNKMAEQIQTLIGNLQHEVHEHRKTETKLREAKEQAETLALTAANQRNFSQLTLQSIVDGVITTDTMGRVTSLNPMAEQLTGWTAEHAVGKLLIQVMHVLAEESREQIYDPIEDIELKSVLDEPVCAILIRKDGGIETPVEYVVAPMRNPDDVIVGIVIIIHDESVQRSLNRQLTYQATHDALTGLINRYEFERRLKNIISLSGEGVRNTLCYLDLDQFKLVNDTCGHTAGDELLKQITMLLQERVRDNDTLARLGGDEFGLLLENCDVGYAETIAQDLMATIQNFSFTWNENNFSIGVSIGIVAITHNAGTCEQLLSNADSACYLAKESGRNRLQIYTAEDDKLIRQQREMHWVSRIKHALEENRFQLYFQEIRRLKSSSEKFINHGEILVRMIDKEGDLISPSSFLPAAERYNMIIAIDEWVVEHTIKWLSHLRRKVLVSINLSGKSISNKDFLNHVVSRIKQYGINPELLCFEVTETAAISHLTTAIHFMTVLKKLGCSFALDDFGSGLSSFSYLTSLPVDYLKIDGSFVVDIDKDPMHHAMVKSINEVGQVMGISTIAEFVASDNIIDCLRDIGVDHIQGYAVSRPVPLESVENGIRTIAPALVDEDTGIPNNIRQLNRD
jgi:diguanylate cyclase (GGDEF)-like protein/PAS domain S-box-containing protein